MVLPSRLGGWGRVAQSLKQYGLGGGSPIASEGIVIEPGFLEQGGGRLVSGLRDGYGSRTFGYPVEG